MKKEFGVTPKIGWNVENPGHSSTNTKDKLKRLIQNGQFEVATGGWSSTDEACPNYEDLINNIMIGHSFMKKEFGVTPKIGWNVENPGHSSTNTRLFSQLGFKAQYFSRVDQDLKVHLSSKNETNKELNFIWRPYGKNAGDQYDIFSSILINPMCYLPGVYVDVIPKNDKNNNPFIDDKESFDYNAPD